MTGGACSLRSVHPACDTVGHRHGGLPSILDRSLAASPLAEEPPRPLALIALFSDVMIAAEAVASRRVEADMRRKPKGNLQPAPSKGRALSAGQLQRHTSKVSELVRVWLLPSVKLERWRKRAPRRRSRSLWRRKSLRPQVKSRKRTEHGGLRSQT